MEDVDGVFELDRIDRAIRITIKVLDNLQDASAAKTLQRLGVRMLLARLSRLERKAEMTLRRFGELLPNLRDCSVSISTASATFRIRGAILNMP